MLAVLEGSNQKHILFIPFNLNGRNMEAEKYKKSIYYKTK